MAYEITPLGVPQATQQAQPAVPGQPASTAGLGLSPWTVPNAPPPYGAQYQNWNPTPLPPKVPPHGLGGLLHNIVTNAGQFASGIGSMVGMGVKDIIKAGEEVASLGKANDSPWYTAQFVRHLPDIASFYKDYYGPLVQGHYGEFGHNVYTQPVQLALDTFTAAGIGSKGIIMAGNRMGGKEALALAHEAEGLKNFGLHEAAEERLAAAFKLRNERVPQWIRALQPGIGTQYPGGAKGLLLGNELTTVPRSTNILKRELFEKPFERFTTEPVQALRDRLAELERQKGQLPITDRVVAENYFETDALRHRIGKAKEFGLTRVDKSSGLWGFYNQRMRWFANGIFGGSHVNYIEARSGFMGKMTPIVKSVKGQESELFASSIGDAEPIHPHADSIDPTVSPEAHGMDMGQVRVPDIAYEPVEPTALTAGAVVRMRIKGQTNPVEVTVVQPGVDRGVLGKGFTYTKAGDPKEFFAPASLVDIERAAGPPAAAVPRATRPPPKMTGAEAKAWLAEGKRTGATTGPMSVGTNYGFERPLTEPGYYVLDRMTPARQVAQQAKGPYATLEEAQAERLRMGKRGRFGLEKEGGGIHYIGPEAETPTAVPTTTAPSLTKGQRVAVTGSKYWRKENAPVIEAALKELPKGSVLLISERSGAANWAKKLAKKLGLKVEEYLPTRDEGALYGASSAGVAANRLFDEGRPDRIFAFTDHLADMSKARTSTDMVMKGYSKGLPTKVHSTDGSVKHVLSPVQRIVHKNVEVGPREPKAVVMKPRGADVPLVDQKDAVLETVNWLKNSPDWAEWTGEEFARREESIRRRFGGEAKLPPPERPKPLGEMMSAAKTDQQVMRALEAHFGEVAAAQIKADVLAGRAGTFGKNQTELFKEMKGRYVPEAQPREAQGELFPTDEETALDASATLITPYGTKSTPAQRADYIEAVAKAGPEPLFKDKPIRQSRPVPPQRGNYPPGPEGTAKFQKAEKAYKQSFAQWSEIADPWLAVFKKEQARLESASGRKLRKTPIKPWWDPTPATLTRPVLLPGGYHEATETGVLSDAAWQPETMAERTLLRNRRGPMRSIAGTLPAEVEDMTPAARKEWLRSPEGAKVSRERTHALFAWMNEQMDRVVQPPPAVREALGLTGSENIFTLDEAKSTTLLKALFPKEAEALIAEARPMVHSYWDTNQALGEYKGPAPRVGEEQPGPAQVEKPLVVQGPAQYALFKKVTEEAGITPVFDYLVYGHNGLVVGLAKKRAGLVPRDDLIQAGAIGLVKAVRGFRLSEGKDFASYAASTIDGEMRRYIRDSAPYLINIPRRVWEDFDNFIKVTNELEVKLGREPTQVEIAKGMGYDLTKQYDLDTMNDLRKVRTMRQVQSLDEGLREGEEESAGTRAGEIEDRPMTGLNARLPVAERLVGMDAMIADMVGIPELPKGHKVFSDLNKAERELVDNLYFSGMSQADYARFMGVQPFRVKKMNAELMKKLQKRLEPYDVYGFKRRGKGGELEAKTREETYVEELLKSMRVKPGGEEYRLRDIADMSDDPRAELLWASPLNPWRFEGSKLYWEGKVGPGQGEKVFIGRVPNGMDPADYLMYAQELHEATVLEHLDTKLGARDAKLFMQNRYFPDQPWMTERRVWADEAVKKVVTPDMTLTEANAVDRDARMKANQEHEAAVMFAEHMKEPIPYYVALDYPALEGYARAQAQEEIINASLLGHIPGDEGFREYTNITQLDAYGALAAYDVIAQAASHIRPDLYPDVNAFYRKVTHEYGNRHEMFKEELNYFGPRRTTIDEAWRMGQSVKGLTTYHLRNMELGGNGVFNVKLFPVADYGVKATADAHTLIHEWGHVLQALLPEDMQTAMLDHYLEHDLEFRADRQDYTPLQKEMAMELAQQIPNTMRWSDRMKERFADDFTSYVVHHLEPPTPALQTPFAILKDAIRRVWVRYRQPLSPNLPKGVKEQLDSIFAQVKDQPTLNEKVWAAGFKSIDEARTSIARKALGDDVTWSQDRYIGKLKPSERADILSRPLPREKPRPTDGVQMLADMAPENRGRGEDVPPKPPEANPQPGYRKTFAGKGFVLKGTEPAERDVATIPQREVEPEVLMGPVRDQWRAHFEDMRPKRKALNPFRDFAPVKSREIDPWLDQERAHAYANLVIGSFDQLPSIRRKLTEMGDIVGVHDYLSNTNEVGYRTVHYDVAMQDGTIVQVRVHTPWSYQNQMVAIPYVRALNNHLDEMYRGGLAAQQGALSEADLKRMLKLQEQLPREQAWIRQIFEPTVHQLREQLDGTPMSKVDVAREQLRMLTLEELTAPMWENTYRHFDDAMSTLFNRQYLPLKMSSGARFEEVTKEGKVTNDFVGGTDELVLHNQRQAAMKHTPIYFPMQRIYDMNPSDFVIPKSLQGMNARARANYAKRNRGVLFKNGQYVVDPMQVFARRASQALRQAETFALVQHIVRTFGRPLTDEQGNKISDYSRSTERLFAPDNLLRFFNQSIHLDDFLDHAMSGLATHDEALREALGVVMENAHGFVKESLGVTTQGQKLFAIPKVVADQLMKQIQPSWARGRAVKLFWDKPTHVWRQAVLTMSPRWLVNNAIGNTIFVALQAGPVGIANVVRAMTPQFRKMVEDLADKDITVFPKTVAPGMYRTGEQYTVHAGDAGIGSLIEHVSQKVGRSNAVKPFAWFSGKMQQWNQAIETAYRQGSFLTEAEKVAASRSGTTMLRSFMSSKDQLEHMFTKGMNADDVARAEKAMNYWMNDYAKMSPLVRHIVKPFIFPFWSFYRHVAKLVLTMPFEHPMSALIGKQLADVSNELTEGYGELPNFLGGAVLWGSGSEPGSATFLSTTGPNPFNAVFQTPFNLLHPGIKTVFEQLTGRTAYSNFSKHFTAPNVISPYGSENQYRVDAQGNVTQLARGVAPSILEELLSQFPQYQTIKDAVAGGSYYTTSGMLDVLKSRMGGYQPGSAVVVDPTKPGVPQYPFDMGQKLLRPLGFSTLDYTVPHYQETQTAESGAALVEYLRRLGIMPPAGTTTGTAAPALLPMASIGG